MVAQHDLSCHTGGLSTCPWLPVTLRPSNCPPKRKEGHRLRARLCHLRPEERSPGRTLAPRPVCPPDVLKGTEPKAWTEWIYEWWMKEKACVHVGGHAHTCARTRACTDAPLPYAQFLGADADEASHAPDVESDEEKPSRGGIGFTCWGFPGSPGCPWQGHVWCHRESALSKWRKGTLTNLLELGLGVSWRSRGDLIM